MPRVKDKDAAGSERVSIRLSPYEARVLWRLRTTGLPDGARPRTVTQVLVHALLAAAERDTTAR